MQLYRQYVFPRLMEWAASGKEFQQLRVSLLQDVRGEVLEIGLGTGLNLPQYPSTVSSLHAVDPASLLPHRVSERSAAVPFPVRISHVGAETLPLADHTLDFAVSTWTLCTIPDPVQALREIRRVLKPTGRFLFLEHGRSDEENVALWQDRLNPLQRLVGCGCNINRRIDQLIIEAGLSVMQLDRFRMGRLPRVVGEMYRGVAAPSNAVDARS